MGLFNILSNIIGSTDNSDKIGGKTLSQWNSEWKSIGPLATANLTEYRNVIGLYRHKINGKIIYIGRAIEVNNGGFRKRLSDYRRQSDSARKHQSGRTIHNELENITTDILIVGNTSQDKATVSLLEKAFISKFKPPLNKQGI